MSEVVCVTNEHDASVAARHLPDLTWVQEQRVRLRNGEPLDLDQRSLLAWMGPSLEPPEDEPLEVRAGITEVHGVRRLVLEAAARVRQPVLDPNLVIAIDTSQSMETVFTRSHPVLQDESEGPHRPIRRIDLAREALLHLLERLPDDSRVSLVAFDGEQGRVIGHSEQLGRNRSSLRSRVQALRTGLVEGHGRATAQFELLFRRPVSRCYHNRLIVLTDHVDQLVPRQALRKMRRAIDPRVEFWNLALGVPGTGRDDPRRLTELTGGPSIRVNAISDADAVWEALLDPGGTVASDVRVRVRNARWRGDDGTWRDGPFQWSLGSLGSGDAHVAVLALGNGVPPAVSVEVNGSAQEVPVVEDTPWTRRIAEAAAWTERPDRVRLDAFEQGPIALELRAWIRHHTAIAFGEATPVRTATRPDDARLWPRHEAVD